MWNLKQKQKQNRKQQQQQQKEMHSWKKRSDVQLPEVKDGRRGIGGLEESDPKGHTFS